MDDRRVFASGFVCWLLAVALYVATVILSSEYLDPSLVDFVTYPATALLPVPLLSLMFGWNLERRIGAALLKPWRLVAKARSSELPPARVLKD